MVLGKSEDVPLIVPNPTELFEFPPKIDWGCGLETGFADPKPNDGVELADSETGFADPKPNDGVVADPKPNDGMELAASNSVVFPLSLESGFLNTVGFVGVCCNDGATSWFFSFSIACSIS